LNVRATPAVEQNQPGSRLTSHRHYAHQHDFSQPATSCSLPRVPGL
jgi:hypothetical protein